MNYLAKNQAFRRPTLDILFNALLFNVSWLAIVYSHSVFLAPVIAIFHLTAHFMLIGRGIPEARFVACVSVLGVVLDQILFAAGVFTVSQNSSAAPLWISCLWPVLATTCAHAFSGFQQRPLLASLLGAIGGSSSYIAGTALTDVEFESALWGPVIMAILWAGLFPVVLKAAYFCVPREAANENAC